MSEIAIYSGNTIIYWSSIVIVLGIAAGFCLSYSLYTANGGRASAMWVFLPIAIILCVFFSRFVHWYTHAEQYAGLFKALTDYSIGSYLMPGVIIGILVSALIVKALHLCPSASELLDALAPGSALGIGIIRLSALFNTSCRSSIIITNPKFQHLPIGIAVPSSTGVIEYRYATFFTQFILMMLLCIFLVIFYQKRHSIPMKRGTQRGNVALIFMLFFSACEIVPDSTRYDPSFFRLNGFVSLVIILSAVTMLTVLLYYSINSVKANGFKFYHPVIWLVFAIGVTLVGYFEYLVQRHGDWYLKCYTFMSIGCILMALSAYFSYLSLCEKEE